jgi:extracellular factor (EF) 3-hydroxypalmitic acid methyl ester biosynthesis protein
VLLDFNRETLAFVQNKMCDAGFDKSDNIEFEYRHESVHNLLMMRGLGSQTEDRFDLIYCSGLFDYLSDRICGRLLSLFYTRTAPGGVVFVTNMHTSNPERRVMDLLMEWYLIYRDEDDLLKLAPRLGCQGVRRDATGVNVALEIRKLPAGD